MCVKSNTKAWLLAFVMGVLLPGLLFSVTEKIVLQAHTHESTVSTTESLPQQQIEQQPEKPVCSIKILQKDGSATEMDLDTYLVGVLLAEMPTDFHMEALKAQAVVARTYGLKRYTSGNKHPGGGVCTDYACCQGYCSEADYLLSGGTQEGIDRVSQAVKDTQNYVLTYGGALIEATYFSCSGGRTEDAVAVWGTEIPYLQAVDSPGEEQAKHFTDSVTFSAGEFTARLGADLRGTPAKWLGSVTYTQGGGVATMMIGGKAYSGTDLRKKLGLRSTAFSMVAVGDSIHITTKGYGHRVGMSQYGAEAMAVAGNTYETILQHYYPGVALHIFQEN